MPAAADGTRCDQFLTSLHPGKSRAFFQRALHSGAIRLNDRICRPSQKVRADDVIHIDWPDEDSHELAPEDIRLDILYEDEHVLVINKCPGLVVHPGKGHSSGTLVNALLFHDEESFGELIDDDLRPGIVHRLDRDTSGVMVAAKNEQARLAMKAAFRERRVEKTYLTIILGEFGAVTGRIDAPIGRHPRNRWKMAVVPDTGKPAGTRYRMLGSTGAVSLMQVQIETGRTHQIRVHFAHLHHPVLGDSTYGGCGADVPFLPQRQMLHAWKLAFPHPVTGVTREYMAPIPHDFHEALETLGLPVIGTPPAPCPPQIGPEDIEAPDEGRNAEP